MRLGYNVNMLRGAEDLAVLEQVTEAERLGYRVVWAAEAYGSDAATPLAWLAGRTSTIELGSAVFQIPARSPAMTAMTAATLDLLSGGRFRLGLGVSGPQVSEGWHGVRFDHPLARTREYVQVVRAALARERVAYQGEHVRLPLPDGQGKALRLALHPARTRIPLYLAAIGPRNLELAGELADGWLAIFFAPEHAPGWLAADAVRPFAALYVGGMGSRQRNFYNDLAAGMGFEPEARLVQERYLAGDRAGAEAALPLAFIDQVALLGPVERVAERLQAYAEAGVTTLNLAAGGPPQVRLALLRGLVAAAERAGVG
jgi:alkanesulfonate monooxygenase SsuD/methylene tetrahydromethanopterin reductase-like flavin-dependent oxidoreductase (luciferase family)